MIFDQVSAVTSPIVTAVVLKKARRLLDIYGGANAAYSLRALSSAWASKDVVEVRRASDDTTRGFTANEIGSTLENWVNAEVALPLDTASGASAAYSLRNLSTSYSGDVVKVRRSSDDTEESFTAAEVADDTLLDWVNTSVSTGPSSGVYTKLSGTGTASNPTINSFDVDAGATSLATNHTGSFSVSSGETVRANVTISGDFSSGNILLVSGGAFTSTAMQEGTHTYDLTALADLPFADIRHNGLSTTTGFSVTVNSIQIIKANGHVTKWYDQSGNDNHAVQATPASQPKVVEGGTLVADGLKFDGGQFMTTTDYAVSLSQNSASVFSVTNATTAKYILTEADDLTSYSSNFIFGGASGTHSLWVNTTEFGSNYPTTSAVTGFDFDGTNFQAYGNGAESGASGTATVNAEVGGYTRIGSDARTTPTTFYTGSISELIIYNSDQSSNRKAIESNMADYHGNIDLPAGFDSGNNEVDGFVATWYDQSGNGNDAVQNVATSQPKIVEGGVLVADGLKFDNTDDYLDSVNQVSFGTGSRSIFATCAPDSIGANTDGIVQLNQVTDLTGKGWLLTPEVATRTNTTTWISSSPATLSQANLISNIYTSGNLHAGNSMFLNGASVSRTSGTDGTINTTTSEIRIGAGSDATVPFDGSIQEILIYDSDQSAKRTGIEGNINDYYEIFADETYRRPDGSAIFRPDGTSVYERP
jgi:hypothetical protein